MMNSTIRSPEQCLRWIRFFCLVMAIGQTATFLTNRAFAAPPSRISFDAQIAPLLAQRCLSCHNGAAKKGGLDLSRKASAKAGGDSGRVIAAGKPDKSLLWERIAAEEMPPESPLSAKERNLLRQWIAEGANWGTDPIDPFRFTTDERAGYDWWSLKPIKNPAAPKVKNENWPRNEIDRFVLTKLDAEGLAPAQEADPRILLRRLYFDLIGLPPVLTEENGKWKEELLGLEIDPAAFHGNSASYAEVVERLLDSPHYGERWARHWLDVIRFGESQGFERNRIRENAWRYRDWVVQSLNRDLPYDEFVRQQIAGDVLFPGELDPLLATGFLVCGTWDQVGHKEGSAEMQKAVRQDDLEDQVAALGQTFLGLTINCARCHDHKFDPISQREYYQMAALLGGVTQEEKERQGISAKPNTTEYREWTKARETLLKEWAAFEQALRKKYGNSQGGNPIAGLQVLYRPSDANGKRLADESGVGKPLDLTAGGKPRFASSGPATKLIAAAKTSHEFTIEAWITPAKTNQTGPARIVTLSRDSGQRNFTLGQDGNRFDLRLRTTKTDQNGLPSLASPEGKAARKKTHVVFTFDRAEEMRCYMDGKQVASRPAAGDFANWNDSFRLAIGNELTGDRLWEGDVHFVAIYNNALTARQIARNFETQSRDVRSGESMETILAKASAGERDRYKAFRRELKRLETRQPSQPFSGVAHVVIPKQPPVFHVLARGDYRNRGDVVSPRGLEAFSRAGLSGDFGLKPDALEAQRRVALAKWLSDPRNPLTPRVMVNRLWHYHFGKGIVDTPSDFGFAGGRPSHPELLDWLAARFVAGGWKLKDMHRLIVTSATYCQASNVELSRAEDIDADNRLLWRGNARRLDGESVRDAMLAVGGALNRKLGGPSYRDVAVKLGTNHEFTNPTGEFYDRRTIYRLWARSGNNPLLESLDCPAPSVMAPRRSETITPVQSLSLLNNRFVEECAKKLADRIRREAGQKDIERQIHRLYRLVLARTPQNRELELSRDFLKRRGLEQLSLVLLNTNEFLFVE